jgi:hypothetical protein
MIQEEKEEVPFELPSADERSLTSKLTAASEASKSLSVLSQLQAKEFKRQKARILKLMAETDNPKEIARLDGMLQKIVNAKEALDQVDEELARESEDEEQDGAQPPP